jgi:hypothetical protein
VPGSARQFGSVLFLVVYVFRQAFALGFGKLFQFLLGHRFMRASDFLLFESQTQME